MSPQAAVSSVTQTTLSFLCRHRRRCLRSHRPLCHFYVATGGGVFGHTDRNVLTCSEEHGSIPAGLALLSRPGGGGVGHSDRNALALSEEHSSITASSVSSIPPRWRWLWSVVHRGMQPAAHWLSVRSRAPSPPVLTSFVSRAGGGGGLRSSTAPSKPVSTHLYRARITAQPGLLVRRTTPS